MRLIHASNSANEHYNTDPSLVPVALALLVMALSLTTIAIIYISSGHLPGYSSKIMELQQKRLRQQYGLPPAHIVTDPRDPSSPSIAQGYAQYQYLRQS